MEQLLTNPGFIVWAIGIVVAIGFSVRFKSIHDRNLKEDLTESKPTSSSDNAQVPI